MEQGSAAWKQLRCGKITGSRFKAVMDLHKRTGAPNASRRKLVSVLRYELETGCPEEVEVNEYMAHGTAMEPLARKAYEFAMDCVCEVPAFLPHPTLPYVGFSPDGLVGTDTLVEIKSPFLEARHTRTVESRKCPADYYAQCQGGLWITGRAVCHFVSYFPSISVEIVPVERDEPYINRLAAECAAVWSEVLTALEQRA